MGWFFVRGIAMVFDRYLQADRTAPASPASSEQGYEQHVGYCCMDRPGHGLGGSHCLAMARALRWGGQGASRKV